MNFNSREFLNQFVANTDLKKSFESTASNQEKLNLVRQHLIENYPAFLDHLSEISRTTCKDYKLSLETKKAANVEFAAKRCHAAMVKTNQSLSVAPARSDLFPFLYGNRSAILFDLKNYKDCISNIDLALAENSPPSLKPKLLFRKTKCLMHLNDPLAAQDLYDQLHNEMDTFIRGKNGHPPEVKQMEELKKKIEIDWQELSREKIPEKFEKLTETQTVPGKHNYVSNGKLIDLTLKSVNETFPVASSRIAVSLSPTFGRSVIAVEDIPPGEVIVVEPPASSVLLPREHFRLTHCHNCLSRRVNCCIPCEECSAIFCDATCKARHQTLGRACRTMQTVQRMEAFGVVEMLALRFVLEQTKQGREIDALWEKTTTSLVDEGERDYPNLVYRLETNEDGREVSDRIIRTFKAVVLCLLLQADSVFPEPKDVSASFSMNDVPIQHCADVRMTSHPLKEMTTSFSPDVLKFGCLLVHYFQVVACNAHDINTFFTAASSADQIQIGSGLYPFCSMFNHSCDPNVVRHTTTGSTIVVSTLKKVRAGEQLFDNYGCHYATHEKAYRQTYLMGQYRFQCGCDACERSFPLYSPSCGDTPLRFREDVIVTASLEGEIKQTASNFEAVLAEMVANSATVKDIGGKLAVVVRYMRLLNDWVEGPRQEFEKCQETYKRLLCYVTNWESLGDGEELPD